MSVFFSRKLLKPFARLAIVLTAAAVSSHFAFSQTGYTTTFGGGPIYSSAAGATNTTELASSGFTEVVVWNIAIDSSGNMNFNGEFPLVSNGAYVGGSTHADFAANVSKLKQGGVKRVTFSLGSSNVGTFQSIQALVNSTASGGGTGPNSILYKDFQTLRATFPALDAIDLDDENNYDAASTVALGKMLGTMGLKVIPDPYTKSSYWTGVAQQINAAVPGTVDQVHLQAYAGGNGNTPCVNWNFGSVPVQPGVGSANSGVSPADDPSSLKTQMSTWHMTCGITGGFLWLYDAFVGQAAQYASALSSGVSAIGVTNATGATQDGGYNVFPIYADGATFSSTGGLDAKGTAYSAQALGASANTNIATAWSSTTIKLPLGTYRSLTLTGTGVNGNQASQAFVVNYTDGTSQTFTQSLSDWFSSQKYAGETVKQTSTYRNRNDGTKDMRSFNLYSYAFTVNATKTVQSLTLPNNRNVVVLSVATN